MKFIEKDRDVRIRIEENEITIFADEIKFLDDLSGLLKQLRLKSNAPLACIESRRRELFRKIRFASTSIEREKWYGEKAERDEATA